MFEIRTFIGVLLLLLLVILVVAKKLKVTNFKILIIGFLFGVSLMPFVMTMGLSFGLPLPLLSPFIQPGLYSDFYFSQEQPTRFPPSWNEMGELIPLSEENKRFIAEHPTTPQPTTLSEIIGAITDGIYYAFIFWIIYFFVRKLRNKTPVQTS